MAVFSLVCGGLGALVYLRFGDRLSPYISQRSFVISSVLLGTSLQQTIEALVRAILGPLGRFISFYQALVEISILRNMDQLSEEAYSNLAEKLIEQRFLKDTNKLLP